MKNTSSYGKGKKSKRFCELKNNMSQNDDEKKHDMTVDDLFSIR